MWKSIENSIVIPKRFVISGSTYNVNIVDCENDIDALGDFCGLLHRIRLAKKAIIDGELTNIPEDEYLKTYLHELGHCFNYYYNNECSEEFANAFSNFMYEYLTSKE